MNTEVHVSFQIIVLSGYMPRSGIARSYSSSVLSFLKKLHTVLWGFPGGLVVKNLPAMQETQEEWVRSLGRVRCPRVRWVRCPGGGNANPLQYSCQENPTDRGAWQATVRRVTRSRTQLKWLTRQAGHASIRSGCGIWSLIFSEFAGLLLSPASCLIVANSLKVVWQRRCPSGIGIF